MKRMTRMIQMALVGGLVIGVLLMGFQAVVAGAQKADTLPPTSMEAASNGRDTTSVMADAATDWPQVQRDPQRTGYAPEVLGANISIAWTHPFQPEKVHPQVQAIVYGSRVFVGTEMGNMYALNVQTGAQEWVYSVNAPILNSVAAAGGSVFFGAMDGAVYALNANTGALVWKSQLSQRLGFSTAPVYVDNKIMLGGRNGVFYALDPASGATVWEYDVDAPILQTAAWNNGQAYFCAMDMRLYAIDTTSGQLAWQSSKIPGMAFKDYWPVVHEGMVYVRPMTMGELGVTDGSTVLSASAQNAVLANYEAQPGNYSLSMRRFYESTGAEAPAVIHYFYQTMNGATAPPCVDRDGLLVVPVPSSTYQSGWGRLDASSRIIVDVFDDGTGAGYGNQDENMNLSCANNLIFAMHTEETNAQYTGFFNLDTRSWSHIGAGHASQEMSTNTQGGGGNPASIADGRVYHLSFHELIVRVAQ